MLLGLGSGRCGCEAVLTRVRITDVAPYVSGKRGREVFINGDVDYGVRSPDLVHLLRGAFRLMEFSI